MEQSLADLVQRRVISADVAYSRSSRPDQLAGILERAGISPGVAAPAMQAPLTSPQPVSDVGLRLAGES